jgi:pyruvate/2-oxoglutarate/acetoin dehydrogenase E1 component
MSETTYREAVRLGMADALAADASVFLLGEDIAAAGGAFKLTAGLMDEFGGERVLDTPISEQAIIGAAIGASIRGLRPVAELMFADFAGVCFDQIANQLAKYRYMTGGQVTVPATIRLVNGAGGGFGAQHSQSVENWFLNVPGLKIAVPGTPADAYALMRAAVRDDDPVLFFEHKALYNVKGDVETGAAPIELGRAAIVRDGTDVTLVATQLMRVRAEEAAATLEAEGISVEIVDPRTLVPLDMAAIAGSLERTNHLVVAQECPHDGSWGASIVSRVTAESFDLLDGPPILVSADATPIPYAGSLERAWIPDAGRIAGAVRETVGSA